MIENARSSREIQKYRWKVHEVKVYSLSRYPWSTMLDWIYLARFILGKRTTVRWTRSFLARRGRITCHDSVDYDVEKRWKPTIKTSSWKIFRTVVTSTRMSSIHYQMNDANNSYRPITGIPLFEEPFPLHPHVHDWFLRPSQLKANM